MNLEGRSAVSQPPRKLVTRTTLVTHHNRIGNSDALRHETTDRPSLREHNASAFHVGDASSSMDPESPGFRQTSKAPTVGRRITQLLVHRHQMHLGAESKKPASNGQGDLPAIFDHDSPSHPGRANLTSGERINHKPRIGPENFPHSKAGIGGEDYNVRLHELLHLWLDSQLDIYAAALQSSCGVGDENTPALAMDNLPGDGSKSAETVLSLKQRHLLASLACYARGLHTSRSASHHDDVAPTVGGPKSKELLTASGWIHEAGHRLLAIKARTATLVATDAMNDVRLASLCHLPRQVWIGQKCATHPDQIDLPVRDRLVA